MKLIIFLSVFFTVTLAAAQKTHKRTLSMLCSPFAMTVVAKDIPEADY